MTTAREKEKQPMSNVLRVHGPLTCERTCSMCDGEHHWMEDSVRAEAIFAKWPEWRPRSDDQSMSLQFHKGRWTWLSINWFSVDPSPATANAHLLAALLPRAIDKWTANGREVSTGIFVRCNGNPPHDLESAIRVLEGK